MITVRVDLAAAPHETALHILTGKCEMRDEPVEGNRPVVVRFRYPSTNWLSW
jgi:hypothetical protein